MNTQLSVFICPSATPFLSIRSNYAGNVGVGWFSNKYDGIVNRNPQLSPKAVGFQHITDGSSHTAVVSEWLVTHPEQHNSRGFAVEVIDQGSGMTLDILVDRCRLLDKTSLTPAFGLFRGEWWESGFGTDSYDHAMMINELSCLIDNAPADFYGVCPPGSLHPGGANVLLMDGHVEFYRDNMSRAVWRSLGTRAGREVVTNDDR